MKDSSFELGNALFGKTRSAVLGLLMGQPDQEFLVRQVSRISRASLGPVQRELKLLANLGILKSRRVGTGLLYSVEIASPVYVALRELTTRTIGLVDVLRDGLLPLSGDIQAAFVFGSFARGEHRTSSDVDVLVIGDVSFKDVVMQLQVSQSLLGREINTVVYPLAEFASKLNEKHHFLTSVMTRPRIFLIGDERDLFRLAKERLAATAHVEPARNGGSVSRGGTRSRGKCRSKARR
jgi:predicted nucleotidyltransferase